MGIETTDQQSPSRRQVQRYSVAGGISASKGNQESLPIEFLKLKNAIVDKRLGVVLKKPGSVQESISGTLGIPLGFGEHKTAANDALIPVRRTLLANFAGSNWRQQSAGSWSSVTVDPVDATINFATSRLSSFCQIGSRMYIAAGTPCYWDGPGQLIRRIGIIPPTAAPTITSYNTGSGITLTQGTRYVVTYYDSTTALESDWSPPSDAVPVINNKSIVIGLPVNTATNWDQKRIYRYLDGGAVPYLVATVGSAATSYTDSTPDDSLTVRIANRFDNAIPVSQSYICAAYSNHLWFVDAADPYKLCVSKPYTGSNNPVSYFPTSQNVRTSEPITALLGTSARMLVFHPRSISVITGSSFDEFDLKKLVDGVGTVFPQSISTNGTDIVMLAEQGFVTITFGGGNRIHLSREIDLDLQPLLAGSYNAAIYASSCWSPSLRQFIFTVSALSSANAVWEEVGTGSTADAVAGWETTPGAVTDTWEDVQAATLGNVTRVKVWGWSPELSDAKGNLWMEFDFPVATDNNLTGAYITTLIHPSPSSDTNDPQQDKTYIGFFSGTVGGVLSAFRKDTNTDLASPITSEIITGRIKPGNQDNGYKYFQALGFDDAYSDPTSDSNATLTYLINYPDPHLRDYASNLNSFIATAVDNKKFTTCEGKHVHLRIVDTSQSQSKVLLSEFFVVFRERTRKSKR